MKFCILVCTLEIRVICCYIILEKIYKHYGENSFHLKLCLCTYRILNSTMYCILNTLLYTVLYNILVGTHKKCFLHKKTQLFNVIWGLKGKKSAVQFNVHLAPLPHQGFKKTQQKKHCLSTQKNLKTVVLTVSCQKLLMIFAFQSRGVEFIVCLFAYIVCAVWQWKDFGSIIPAQILRLLPKLRE